MFSIIGIVVVFGAVLAGYLMEHGNLKVLMQPAELIIILGAAIGTVLIANPLYSSAQVDQKKAGRIAMAIQVAFQEMGVFQASSTKIPMRDDNAMPFEVAQVVENVVKKNDLKKLVNPMKGDLTNSAEVESLMDAKSELEKALAPEMQRNEVTMELHREGLVVSLKEMGFFESGSDIIRPKSMDAIVRLANVLRRRNENIRFEGHTDNVPIHNAHFASNWQLSTSRATEMIKLMITQYGIPADHLSAAGYVEFHPVATNSTPEGRAQNRRMDVVILAPTESTSEPASAQPTEVVPGP